MKYLKSSTRDLYKTLSKRFSGIRTVIPSEKSSQIASGIVSENPQRILFPNFVRKVLQKSTFYFSRNFTKGMSEYFSRSFSEITPAITYPGNFLRYSRRGSFKSTHDISTVILNSFRNSFENSWSNCF